MKKLDSEWVSWAEPAPYDYAKECERLRILNTELITAMQEWDTVLQQIGFPRAAQAAVEKFRAAIAKAGA